MTDQEIIQGLIARDNRVTKEFFFDKCRPLFCSIMQKVFDYEVDYDELVNELYVYLMENDAIKFLEDWEPEQLAKDMNITTANLYNIKRRAVAQLTRAALNDIKEYGK